MKTNLQVPVLLTVGVVGYGGKGRRVEQAAAAEAVDNAGGGEQPPKGIETERAAAAALQPSPPGQDPVGSVATGEVGV